MDYVNAVRLVGVVIKKPEIKYTAKGTARAEFKVETKEFYNDREFKQFHKIVGWGKVGEYIDKNVKENQWVEVSGSINYACFKDPKTGREIRWTEIKAYPVKVLSEVPVPVEDQSQEEEVTW